MKCQRKFHLFWIASLAAVALLPGAAPAAQCDADVVPAATLLVPYFEVDLDRPNAHTTLLAVTNLEKSPVLANVVLWTDWAIPTLSFEVYLAGFDVQTLNLRDVFIHGRLPATGAGVSPHGVLSEAPVDFPGCNNGSNPGMAPVFPDPALEATELERLQAFHTGECFEGQQAGQPDPTGFGDNIARGYVTIDVVERCSGLTPADEGYFVEGDGGVAGVRNALTGDFFSVNSEEDFAQGERAVHIEAFREAFSPGDYTFYRRYVDGTAIDGREPLGTQYSVRHLVGGVFDGGTDLLVWRDTGSAVAEPVACETRPEWFGSAGLESYSVRIGEDGTARQAEEFDDFCAILPPCPEERAFPLATQAQTLSSLADSIRFGVTHINLRRATTDEPSEWEILQGWAGARNSASGRFSVGQRAVRLDSACDPGPVEPSPADFE